MKAICTFCGHTNRAEAQVCAQCGGSLAGARRQRLKIPWASWVPAIPVAALLWFQYANAEQAATVTKAEHQRVMKTLAVEHKASMQKLQAEFDAREAESEQKHRAFLSNPRVVSGEEAGALHEEERKRREKHDPALAATLLEKTLLQVERLGKDSALTAEAALQKVAELVTPRGSRIEVKPGDHGFIVRVAFRLSAVNPEEAGGATRHDSSAEVRKEIEEVTARMIKDLFDYTGARGIQRLSVSCNRALLEGNDDAQRLAMRSLYRAVVEAPQAADVANWRSLSMAQVAGIMKIEHDVISGIIITTSFKPGLTIDPNEPLEF